MEELDALHGPLEASRTPGIPDRATYRESVPDRSNWRRTKDAVRRLFLLGEPPRVEREVEDPVAFALYRIRALRTRPLPVLEQVEASLLLCRFGRDDPSRAVRAEAFSVLEQWGRRWFVELDYSAADDAEAIQASVESVTELTRDPSAVLARDSQAAHELVRRFAALRPSDPRLADRLARVAMLAHRRTEDEALRARWLDAAFRHAERTLVLSLGHGVLDPEVAVQSIAMQTLALRSPAMLLTLVSGLRGLDEFDPLVQVRLLRGLAEQKLRPADIAAPLRPVLAEGLYSVDAGVSHWTARFLASVLGADPNTRPEELEGAWRALGESGEGHGGATGG